jgi:hypothetical protein
MEPTLAPGDRVIAAVPAGAARAAGEEGSMIVRAWHGRGD